ncbi:hypothetical protein [Nocardiopsis ansamitocini]|uniref:Flp family type IVb pilin n=1 Tax=Nocardiopsis ansamitocini TaxID=1670832 RepID=A0A9W6UGM5_9ACTN|nr:hypothetical protein [Nocardiopsis ansamitocini]GLU47761.1 hypothetical protein Nans01_21120 [Nocardiopsis ansamitocini]
MKNPMISLYFTTRSAVANRIDSLRGRGDRGAGFVEYAAVIVLVAAIAAAIFATNIGQTIAGSLTTTVAQILGGGTPATPTNPNLPQ